MKKLFAYFLIATCISNVAYAQKTYNSTGRQGKAQYRNNESVKGFDKSKIILGAGMNLGLGSSYGSTIFRAGINPMIGYKVNNWLSAGISLGFQYFSARNYYQIYNPDGTYSYKPLRQTIYSGGIWTRIMPIENIFAHVELEHNRIAQTQYQMDGFGNVHKLKNKVNVNSLLVGAGYRMPMNDRISLVYTILYDALQNSKSNTYVDPANGQTYSYSPYANTLEYRVGIMIGF